ncbi:MAG: hypothetical protein KGH53_00025 [Candidatus Micrarchaeota archaeon]|nr:hypothetical protein [Candidatus Micrarchaeota archaeon]
MIGILLSIGAINALIPIIVILILIAAAAGSTRGSKLFEMFGISALLGMSVGRGTLQKQSPFKSKRFKYGANPFQKLTGPAAGAAVKGVQQVLSKAEIGRAANKSFDNLGGTGQTLSDFSHQQIDKTKKDLASRGFSGMLTNKQEEKMRMAVDTHLKAHEQGFRVRKQEIINNPALGKAQKAQALNALRKEHNITISKSLDKLEGTLANITKVSKDATLGIGALSIRDQLRVMKYDELAKQVKSSRINLSQLGYKQTIPPSTIQKVKFEPLKLRRQQQNEMRKLEEAANELKKLENENPQIRGILNHIRSTKDAKMSSDINNSLVGAKLGGKILNLKKYNSAK